MTDKKRSNGITRDEWMRTAEFRAETAKQLLWLAGRSLDILTAGYEGRDGYTTEPVRGGDSCIVPMAAARGAAEAQLLDLKNGPDRTRPEGLPETELRCLLGTLQEFASRLGADAEVFAQCANLVRRGRPTRLPDGFGQRRTALKQAVGKPGRPRVAAIADDDLMGRLGDAKRIAPLRSERAILEDLARLLLVQEGRHTAGDRVRRLTQNLQKRVAAIRAARVPKSPADIPGLPSGKAE